MLVILSSCSLINSLVIIFNFSNDTNEVKIFNNLAHKENKCVIIVTHSGNVCDSVDQVYDLKKNKNI